MAVDFEAMRDSQKDLAYHVWQYYRMLEDQGFTKDQAILLAVEWQKAILGVR